MSLIQPLAREMIVQTCKAKGWDPVLDEDGLNLYVFFDFDEEYRRSLLLALGAVGEEHEILKIRMVSQEQFAKQEWGRVIIACNKWNMKRLWPRAYLNCEGEGDAELGSGLFLDCEKGIHQEMVDYQVGLIFGSALNFFRWGYKEEGLWT